MEWRHKSLDSQYASAATSSKDLDSPRRLANRCFDVMTGRDKRGVYAIATDRRIQYRNHRRSMRSDLSLRHGCALMLLVVFFGAYGCGSGGGDNDMVSPRLTPTSAPSPSPPVASPTVGGIQAIAVGALSVPVGENQGVILRSRDSGSSWTVVQTVANSLNALSFPDHNNGWAVGPSSIVHSADSGDSWSVQREIPEDLRDVEFTSSSHGVAVGGLPPQPGNFSGGGLVLVTDDSGTTWSPVTLPQSVPLQRATLMSVCFTTTATGVTFGEGVS